MKQNIQNIFFLFLLGTIGVNAQGPVITAAGYNPRIGDSYKLQTAKTILSIPNLSGINKVWDFSNLVDSSAPVIISFISPKGQLGVDSFPTANILELESDFPNSKYYIRTSDSSWGQVGYYFYDSLNIYPTNVNLDNPQFTNMVYPMTVNTKYYDSAVVYYGGLGYPSHHTYYDTIIGVGYGILKLPSVTYDSVVCVYNNGSFWFIVNGVHCPLLIIAKSYYNYGGGWTGLWRAIYNAGTPLPLQITSFTASWQNKLPYLQWSATNTENTKAFNIQRSVDGNTFSNIGQVAANISTAYHFTDNYTPTSTVYYRLQQVDKTGKFFYSNVTQLTVNRLPLTVAPNPARGAIHLMIPAESRVQVLIYNMLGKLVYENKNFTATDAINTSTWSKGTYTVRVKDNNGWQVITFEKE